MIDEFTKQRYLKFAPKFVDIYLSEGKMQAVAAAVSEFGVDHGFEDLQPYITQEFTS